MQHITYDVSMRMYYKCSIACVFVIVCVRVHACHVRIADAKGPETEQ